MIVNRKWGRENAIDILAPARERERT